MFRLLPAVLTLVLAGSAAAAAAPALDHGSFAASCAPWDGSAVRFNIAPAGAEYPGLVLALYTGPAEIKPKTYSLPLDGHTGYVGYCTAPNVCKLVEQGEIRLTSFSPWTAAAISYDVTVQGGEKLTGEATLAGSDQKTVCR